VAEHKAARFIKMIEVPQEQENNNKFSEFVFTRLLC